jgi:hypothetical protein
VVKAEVEKDEYSKLLEAARGALAAIPAPAPDVAAGALLQAAETACERLWIAARSRLFPRDVKPLGDSLRELDALLAGAGGDVAGHAPSLGEILADIHKRALASHEGLASVIRSVGSARVGARARLMATALQRPAEVLATEAVAGFQTAIAADLASAGVLLPWSKALSTDVPALDAELAKHRAEHEAFAAGELARIKAESAAADAVLEAQRKNRRAELAAGAAGHDADAERMRRAALLERGEELARRVERLKVPSVRVTRSESFSTEDLVRGLRRGTEASFMDRVEAALDGHDARRSA